MQICLPFVATIIINRLLLKLCRDKIHILVVRAVITKSATLSRWKNALHIVVRLSEQKARDLLSTSLQHINQIFRNSLVVSPTKEADRSSRVAYTTCPTYAMHIIVHAFGHVEIDHIVNAGYVQTTSRYIRRHHHIRFALFEISQRLLTLILLPIAMYACRLEAVVQQLHRHNICHSFA
ncbi:hypothetical protein T10_5268 [Trichinella papuae]|uniref:Uncharacterized protein n=1 Tax=Trichinella papuae TaxID=268474 RepID=A0A0V1M5C0_9BILA|nr:hypothetical protein T10_5268 [Trichinella papuae]